MLDCHSPNEDMFLLFCRQMAQIVRIFVVFCQFLKIHPIFQVYLAFIAQEENALSALEPACMLLSLFVLHQKLFKGGSLIFCQDAGEGDQTFVERVLECTPSPKSHAPFP